MQQNKLGLTGARARLSCRGARATAVLLVAVLLSRLTLTAACGVTHQVGKVMLCKQSQYDHIIHMCSLYECTTTCIYFLSVYLPKDKLYHGWPKAPTFAK